ncbi:hypothetical protein WJX74_000525 [Apatococcus lobatus]|uniref:Uncharacterized protein n=1 Tax=Apatococcus lobatus TaxID=904363 RepID=A0AAW1SA58_9CHLO
MAASLSSLSDQALFKYPSGSSPCGLVDIGLNLSDSSFDKDRTAVISRAKDAGVIAFIITGSCLNTSKKAAALADSISEVAAYFTAGVHPHNAKDCNESTMIELEQIAAHPRCVAVGECGLDFNRNFSPPQVQERWFDAQIALATKLRKPLFLHCRDASDKFSAIIRQHTLSAPAIAHCFTGNKAELESLLALDCYIGITGWVCDDRPHRGGAELAALLPQIPPDRLMIETDAPYLTPRTIKPNRIRPSRNEPALLPHVLNQVAQALGKSLEEVATQTTHTANRVFSLRLDSM